MTIQNPTKDAVEPEQEKAFAGKHEILKTHSSSYHAPQFNKDDEEAEENHFTAKNIKVAPYKGRKEVPLDQRGEGTPFSNLAPQQKNHVQEGEEVSEEKEINELSKDKLGSYIVKARQSQDKNLKDKKNFVKRQVGINKASHLAKSND